MSPEAKADTSPAGELDFGLGFEVIDGGLDVADELRCGGLGFVFLADFDVFGGVAGFKAGGLTLVDGWGDRDISFFCYSFGNFANVGVDAKDFLDDDNGGKFALGGGLGEVGGYLQISVGNRDVFGVNFCVCHGNFFK